MSTLEDIGGYVTATDTPPKPVLVLQEDAYLQPLVDMCGPLQLVPANDPFARLILSICRQQVSIDAADAIIRRLFDRFEVIPQALAQADEAALRDVGLSRQKSQYVKAIARAHLEHGYDRAYFSDASDEEVIQEVTTIRGVGPWTAKMYLIFCLERHDVFPIEDLGIRRAMEKHVEADMTRTAMCEFATRWQPYRTYASLYLWEAME